MEEWLDKYVSWQLTDSNTDFSRKYSEIFQNTYVQVEILENKIYSCFLMNKVIHSLLEEVKTVYWNSFTIKGIWYSVKCLFNFFILETAFPQIPIRNLAGKINRICKSSSKYIEFFSMLVLKKVPESISGRCSFSMLLYFLWYKIGALAKN